MAIRETLAPNSNKMRVLGIAGFALAGIEGGFTTISKVASRIPTALSQGPKMLFGSINIVSHLDSSLRHLDPEVIKHYVYVQDIFPQNIFPILVMVLSAGLFGLGTRRALKHRRIPEGLEKSKISLAI